MDSTRSRLLTPARRLALGGYLRMVAQKSAREGKTLAAELGWTPSKLSRLFSGKTIKFTPYSVLAEHLGVDLDALDEQTDQIAEQLSTIPSSRVTEDDVMTRNARIITICMEKGGVGKTTLSTGLATGLAKLGKRVLLLDLDAQANATAMLTGQYNETDQGAGLIAALRAGDSLPVEETDYGVDLVASGRQMSLADLVFRNMAAGGFARIARLLSKHTPDYDYVVIDTPPTLGPITTAAVYAATHVLMPVKPNGFSLDAVLRTQTLLEEVRETCNGQFELAGCVMMGHRRTVVTREVIKELKALEEIPLIERYLSHSTLYDEANFMRVPIPTLDDQGHKIVREFMSLVKHLDAKIGGPALVEAATA